MERIKNLNINDLESSVLTLRAVNHELRQKIISLLLEKDNMTVTQIYIKLRVEQSVASQHLAILRKASLLRTERDGKFIYYSVNHGILDQISVLVGKLSKVSLASASA